MDGSAATVPLRPGEIVGLKFTPDNRALATVTVDGRVVLRRANTGTAIREVRLKRGGKILDSCKLTKGAFSADTRIVAAGCDILQAQGKVARGVAVWETETGNLKFAWELPPGEPLQFTFRNDGKCLAATTGRWSVYHGQSEWHGDGVAVYDLAAGKPLWTREISPDEPSYVSLCFVPGTSRLALMRRGISLAFWDGETGTTIREFQSSNLTCYIVVADSKGEHFAVCDGDCALMFDHDGNRLAVLSGHTGLITQAAFSADGRQLLTSGLDHVLRKWTVPINPTAISLVGHTSSIVWSDISADGRRAASLDQNGELKIWEATGGDPPALFTNCGHEWTPGVAFGPGMKWLASGSGDGQLIVWDMSNGRRLRTIQCPEGISSLAVSPDGSKLAVGYDKHGAAIWDPQSGKRIGKFPIDQSIDGIVFSPDGRLVLTVGANRHATVWHVASLKMAAAFVSHTGDVTCGAFSPNGNLVATADQTGAVVLWDPATGGVIQSIQAHATRATCVAFSPDGKTLATANGNRDSTQVPVQIRLWDAQSGKMKLELKGHELSIWCLAFTPNGDRLMSGSEDKTIMVWDIRRGQLVMTLKGHTDDVRCLAFSADGNVLVSSNDDNYIRFWDATPVFNGPGIKARFLDDNP